MVMYIASYKVSQSIQVAIDVAKRTVLVQKIQSNFTIGDFLKQQLEKIQAMKTLIIDLSALKDSDDEIYESLNGFRLINDNLQIIIIAPYRKPGDKLLGDIFSMGIYDIITFEDEDKDNCKKNLIESLTSGKRYKDSLQFKTDTISDKEIDDKKQKQIIKETVIIKTEKSVSKALIGFIGVQARLGVTHNCIVSANYLRSIGYKVAIIESDVNRNKVFETIKDIEVVEDHMEENYFTYQNVDYYPNYSIEKTYKIQSKGYNFILIDFGTFDQQTNLVELSRCVKSIVLLGSKPWEIGEANTLFSSVDTSILEQYCYLFNFTAEDKQSYLKESMSTLKNVIFADYCPDPFNVSKKVCMDKLFSEYKTTSNVNLVNQKGSLLRKVLGKHVSKKG